MAHSSRTSHARLHKRGHSASSITSPSGLSPLSDAQAFAFNRSETPKLVYEESFSETMPAKTPKIKPFLRKLSKETNAVDLSRPAAENGLAGLGISEYGGSPRSVADVTFTGKNNRARHNRSTSNTSQFSTSSSLRPAAPYLPPIRQTPQPYTPPLAKSTPPSLSDNADDIMTDEEYQARQAAFDPARRSGSLSALRIHTNGSSTRLGGNYSQSTLSLTSPTIPARARGDTMKSMETTTSPSSRTSFDKTFGFIRGRDTPADATSRAASIRAARQAFNEKEEAKERKHDKEASKQAEREYIKQYKRGERKRQMSDAEIVTEHTRARSTSDTKSDKANTPRPSIGGRQYSDHRHAHTRSLPVTIVENEKENGAQPQVTKSRAAKGRWMRFVTWFKTRLLRMSKTLHVSS